MLFDKKQVRSKTITIRLTEREYDALAALSNEQDISKSLLLSEITNIFCFAWQKNDSSFLDEATRIKKEYSDTGVI